MNSQTTPAGSSTHEIQVAGLDLQFHTVSLHDSTPTGAQISAACGFTPSQQVTVLQFLEGSLEDVRPDEVAHLRDGNARFVVVESDGSWRLTVDGKRIDWPASEILVATVRKLVAVPMEKRIYLEREDEPDALLDEDQCIDLARGGTELLSTRVPTWTLNVQGVRLTVRAPTILVKDALTQAGFNSDQGWHIYLKVEGQPKEEVQLDALIDLRRPGIEKLRLTPKDVSNGEAVLTPSRAFRLLDSDEEFLDAYFSDWESIVDGGRQWLMIPQLSLPAGYSVTDVSLALEIPSTYPGAQIDMFYVHPPITLHAGTQIPATEARMPILGQEFQRWSRHRGAAAPWQVGMDSVVTHLALVESALLKEVQL